MRRYLDPTEVAQAVQDCISIHAIARRFALFPSKGSGTWRRFQDTQSGRGGQCLRRPSALLISASFGRGTEWAMAEPYKTTPVSHWCKCLQPTIRNRLHEGGLRAWHPLVEPVLTAWHCGTRLPFAIGHQNWHPFNLVVLLIHLESPGRDPNPSCKGTGLQF